MAVFDGFIRKFIENKKIMKTALSFIMSTLIFLGLAIMFTNCHTLKRNSNKANILVENFDEFYNKFHSDSTFQKSRIKFPLKGQKVDSEGTHSWSKTNWVLMKVKIYDVDTATYKVDYHQLEKVFTQKIWLEDSGFSSEYRFELIDRKWYLVYALENNL